MVLLIDAAGILSVISVSRVEPSVLALPIGLGLLTRGTSWRVAALVYCVLHAAVTFGVVAFLLRLGVSQPAAAATGLAAAPALTMLSVADTALLVSYGFTVLREPEVRALFHGSSLSPGV